MPNPLNRRKGQQWQECDRCGFPYPMGSLTKQKGLMLCSKDLDNLEIERRDIEIERILGSNETEGVDTRVFDQSFFDGFDTEIQ